MPFLFILRCKFNRKALAREGEDRVGITVTDEGEGAGNKGAGGKGLERSSVGIEGARGGIDGYGTDNGSIKGQISLLLGSEGEYRTKIAVGNAEAQRCHAHLDSELGGIVCKYALDLVRKKLPL